MKRLQLAILALSLFAVTYSNAQTITASNGLNRNVDDIQMGGDLTAPVTIPLKTFNLWFKTNTNTSERYDYTNADGHVYIGDSAHIPLFAKEIATGSGINYIGRQNGAALIIAKKKNNNNENVNLFSMTTADAPYRNGWLFYNYSNSAGNVVPTMETYSNASNGEGYLHHVYVKNAVASYSAYRILIKNYDTMNVSGNSFQAVRNRNLFSIENGVTAYGMTGYSLFNIDSIGRWSGDAYKNTDTANVLTADANGMLKFRSIPRASYDGSETKVTAGSNVTVTGSGTTASPYVVSANTNLTPLQWSNSTIGTNNIVNSNTGAVIIGAAVSSLPAGYKLYVSDGILAEKVKVALRSSSHWADYVFDKNYKLANLKDVVKFANANGHLPGVPSAKTLEKEGGIDVTTMLTVQMQKIEELTLYMSQLNDKVEKLEKENKKLKAACTSHK